MNVAVEPSPAKFIWRPLQAADLAQLGAIALRVHPEFRAVAGYGAHSRYMVRPL